MSREVYVDQDECTSCGQCADNLPEVFAMDEDDLAYVSDSNGASEEAIQEEIDQCPGECIHWKE
ncbi:MAG: ferredoxin [Spirochaetota bacterium]|nr:ferredoxin [Spirochaetota bacterium]